MVPTANFTNGWRRFRLMWLRSHDSGVPTDGFG